MKLHFERAFVDDRWARSVTIELDAAGLIVRADCDGDPPEDAIRINGIAVPGLINVHSHAFQRVIAGRTEYRNESTDSFWTWREQMYSIGNRVQSEHLQHIAALLYAEMLMAGYTTVGEFHYLHNDVAGHPYGRLATNSEALVAAANTVGMTMCLLPVLYQRSGFEADGVLEHQRRFALREDSFCSLVADMDAAHRDSTSVRVGVALHSLRAVPAEVIRRTVDRLLVDDPSRPVHIHVAEQPAEVEQCLRATGCRPVELLLKTQDVGPQWCLIHATHLNDTELAGIADRQAVAGLCPTTEANLGDGIFRAAEFVESGGRIAIGSDSHVTVDPASELRLLEYGQRLLSHERNVLATPDDSTGASLVHRSLAGGRQALAMPIGRLSPGFRGDIVVLDDEHPSLVGVADERVFDVWVFCEHGRLVRDVFHGGRPVVKDGRHVAEDMLRAEYARVVGEVS